MARLISILVLIIALLGGLVVLFTHRDQATGIISQVAATDTSYSTCWAGTIYLSTKCESLIRSVQDSCWDGGAFQHYTCKDKDIVQMGEDGSYSITLKCHNELDTDGVTRDYCLYGEGQL